jgi:hypothetical protein
MKSENNMKEYIQVWSAMVLGFIMFLMVVMGGGKYRKYRQANICQELGVLYGLKATSIDNYGWSNASDCYLKYKGRWVEVWYIEMVNTRDFK